ncbi:hypothetical protein GWK47_000744 [Chionoecetes opilio]|uniref:Uncharacterized protein n=1 Tax=Chionoecetes opilio TaxID=41210 RepID=A0A8J4Y328_CHIOP|nr:hypothetical protein GWK47_000744 [Chionoecetes opilio]
MKVVALCMLAVAALVGGAAADLPPPERSYKILMLLPIATKSHTNMFMPLVEALADRGHKIAYPFVHEVPFIIIATSGLDARQSATFGNVLNPSYAPNFLGSYPLPMSLWHRLMNTYMHLWIPFVWRIGLSCRWYKKR